MRYVSSMLGALGIAIAGGLTLGMTTPTDPITRDSDPLANIPQHEVQSLSVEDARKRQPARDQYPLKTPDGVIPVRELAYYGRMRSRMREQPMYGAQSEAEAFGLDQRHDYDNQRALDAMQPRPAAQPQHAASRHEGNFVPLEPGIFDDSPAYEVSGTHAEAGTISVSVGYSDNG